MGLIEFARGFFKRPVNAMVGTNVSDFDAWLKSKGAIVWLVNGYDSQPEDLIGRNSDTFDNFKATMERYTQAYDNVLGFKQNMGAGTWKYTFWRAGISVYVNE